MEPRVGLALSGGGFRAAAFHVGVLRGLHEIGVLDQVQVVSGVSGGALLGAAWACHDGGFEAFESRMRGFLTRDLKRRVLLAALRPDRAVRLLASPRYSLTEVLADVLDREVFHGRTLGSLRGSTPRLVLNATALNHGTGFRMSADRVGDWIVSTQDRRVLDRFPLARAVAASAAFPGGFAPVVLGHEVWGGRPGRPREVMLTDGGVDDNFGVAPLAGCDRVVVSDGSAPFVTDDRPLDRFGLPAGRRLALAVLVPLLAVLGSDHLGVPGVLLAALLMACVLVGLRLRLAVYLLGTVMMRGQRRGVLRRVHGGQDEDGRTWLSLGTALGEEQEKALAAAGVDRERLRRVSTDLDLHPRDFDALAALGAALARAHVRPAAGRRRAIG